MIQSSTTEEPKVIISLSEYEDLIDQSKKIREFMFGGDDKFMCLYIDNHNRIILKRTILSAKDHDIVKVMSDSNKELMDENIIHLDTIDIQNQKIKRLQSEIMYLQSR